MSVNVYLKDSIRQAEGFVEKQCNDSPKTYYTYSFKDIPLLISEFRLHCTIQSLNSKIPDVLEAFVEEISYLEHFRCKQGRQIGLYRSGDLVAELDNYPYEQYRLAMRGCMESFPAMLELYRAIRAGSISPSESWEEGQPSRPPADIEKDLEVAQARIQELEDMYARSLEPMHLLLRERQYYYDTFYLAMGFLQSINNHVRDSSRFIRSKPLHTMISDAINSLYKRLEIPQPDNNSK